MQNIRDVGTACGAPAFPRGFARNLIYNGYTLVRILPIEYEEGCSTAQGIVEWRCSENATINEISELRPLERFNVERKVSIRREEKMKLEHTGIQTILDSFYRCHNDCLEGTTSRRSCWRLVLFVLSYCCDIQDGKDIYFMRYVPTADRFCILILVCREEICSTNCAVIRKRAAHLRAREICTMVMNRFCPMHAAIYGQVRLEELLNAGSTVSLPSLPSIPSFLKRGEDALGSFSEDVYSVFTSKPLH